MAFYDFDKINSEIRIEDVLAKYGIVAKKGGWYSIRPEDKTPSARIDAQRRFGNTIRDYGINKTFTPLTLTMYFENLREEEVKDKIKASQILGEYFGIEPIEYNKNQDAEISDPNYVSSREWFDLFIYPDDVSKNLSLFPDKFGAERTTAYADKFNMSMNELRKLDSPDARDVYQKIVRSHGISHVMELRNTYLSALYSWHDMRQQLNVALDIEKLKTDEEITKPFEALKSAQKILMKAIEGTDIKFKETAYDIVSDFNKLVNGELAFEIGQESHYDIKCAAYHEHAKVFYCLVSREEYYKLMDNGMDNLRTAAFMKGNEVNIAFVSTDSSRMNYLVRALRGKEQINDKDGANLSVKEQFEEVVSATAPKNKSDLQSGEGIRRAENDLDK